MRADESEQRQEYKLVYDSILSSLNGTMEPSFSLQLPNAPNSLLQHSHALALSILQSARDRTAQGHESNWLDDALGDRRGWIESNHKIDGDAISSWSWSFLNYVYPAVRLALVAAGQLDGLGDPGGRLLAERREVNNLLSSYSHAFRTAAEENTQQQTWITERLERAVTAFEDQLMRTPRDELLLSWLGDALLRLSRLDEAGEALNRCMVLSSCGPRTRASALYNLACVKARQGLTEDCRTLLEESERLQPLNREHTVADPDLESVRSAAWFIDLVNRNE